MSIVIALIIVLVVGTLIARFYPKPFPPQETTVHIEPQVQPHVPTPRVEPEPLVIENSITTPVVLGSDNVPTKPKKKPTAKMSATPKKAKTKKTNA